MSAARPRRRLGRACRSRAPPGVWRGNSPPGDFHVDATAGTVALTASGVATAGGGGRRGLLDPDRHAGRARHARPGALDRPPARTRRSPGSFRPGRCRPREARSTTTGIVQSRQGNFLRIYLDRPWYSSGGGELLGVVTRLDDATARRDPAGLHERRRRRPDLRRPLLRLGQLHGHRSFLNQTFVPSVPGRPAYSSPPELSLVEDTSGAKYRIWPFEVKFDPHTPAVVRATSGSASATTSASRTAPTRRCSSASHWRASSRGRSTGSRSRRSCWRRSRNRFPTGRCS